MTEARSDIEPFDAIIDLFHARTGIIYPLPRRLDAQAGIRRAMNQAGVTEPTLFLDRLSNDRDLFSRLVEHLTVAETYFFRDIAQFDQIRNHIVPELRALRGPDSTLRAWSAGCSSGEEAYSLAILFEQEGISSRVLATDISPKALAKAKHGVYGPWSLRGEGHRAATYIGLNNARLTIPDRLRARVDIRHLNLVSDAYPSLASGTTELDLILCRNVLIYFDDDSIRSVASRLHACLASGGWLVTGPSDPPLWDYTDLEPVTTSAGVFYRHIPHHRRTVKWHPSDVLIAEPKKRSEQKKRVPSRPQTKTSRPLSEHHRDPENDTPQLNDPLSIVACIRNLADRGELADAITASETAIAADPAVPELHYLRAIALIAQDRKEEAFEALRRVIYLDRSLAIAHFAMGTLLIRRGDFAKARRAFQRTYVLCAANDPDEILPLSDGARADGLAEAARTHIEMLNRDKRLSEGSHAN